MFLLARCSQVSLKQGLPLRTRHFSLCIPLRGTPSRLQYHASLRGLHPLHRGLSSTSNTENAPDAKAEHSGKPVPAPKRSILSRLVPSSGHDASKSASSFRSIMALAKPEKKPLGIAVGLLLISSTVSMSIPLTVGKLIDYFTSPVPVSTTLQVHIRS